MTTETLKPCPFCGGKAQLIEDDRFAKVMCEDGCNARTAGWTKGKPRPATAIKAWNTRPRCDECRYCGEVKSKYAWCNVFEVSFGVDHYCAKFERSPD
jgi:Lar family restriction alleviation protein